MAFFFWSNYCMAMDLYRCPEGHVNMLLGLCAQDMAQYRGPRVWTQCFWGKSVSKIWPSIGT